MPRIHITGGSGTGATTLGWFLAARSGATHFDTDDFCWLPTRPAYRIRRDESERVRLIRRILARLDSYILSGSFVDWGNALAPLFDAVIFLSAPAAVRVERLRRRDLERHGSAALAPGGWLHEQQEAFYAWAATYDTGSGGGRSRAKHEAWLESLRCQVIRLESADSPALICDQVLCQLRIVN